MRTETMSIKEFMNRGKETITAEEKEVMKKGKTAGMAFGLSMLPLAFSPIKAKPVSAHEVVTTVAVPDMSEKIMIAFEPLIDLVQVLAYPVAMVVALGGVIMVMIRNPEKGYSMMMSAGLGIILINIVPMVLDILIEVMKSAV